MGTLNPRRRVDPNRVKVILESRREVLNEQYGSEEIINNVESDEENMYSNNRPAPPKTVKEYDPIPRLNKKGMFTDVVINGVAIQIVDPAFVLQLQNLINMQTKRLNDLTNTLRNVRSLGDKHVREITELRRQLANKVNLSDSQY
jgi:hypothetical protein